MKVPLLSLEYPNKKNYEFLKKIKLKTILCLAPDDYAHQEFLHENDIQFFQFNLQGNKEPFTEIPEKDIADALTKVMDKRNHPILIHCHKGKHRVGCLIGCLRKLQNWSMTSIFDEYRRFTGSKIRIADQEFMEVFSQQLELNQEHLPSWFVPRSSLIKLV